MVNVFVSAGHTFSSLTIISLCFSRDIKTLSGKVRSYRTILTPPCNNNLLLKTVKVLLHLGYLHSPKQGKNEGGRVGTETNPLTEIVIRETTEIYIFQTSDTIIISNPIKEFIKIQREKIFLNMH